MVRSLEIDDGEVEGFLDRQEQQRSKHINKNRHGVVSHAYSSNSSSLRNVIMRLLSTPRILIALVTLTVIVVVVIGNRTNNDEYIGEEEELSKPPITAAVREPPPRPFRTPAPVAPPPAEHVPAPVPPAPTPTAVVVTPDYTKEEPTAKGTDDVKKDEGNQEPSTDDKGGEDTGKGGGTEDGGDDKGTIDEKTNKLVYSQYSKIPPDPDHVPISDATRAELIEKWDRWKFYDGDEDMRPTGNYLAPYLNSDMPSDDFPDEAWQADAVFVNHLLDAAENLLNRAKEALFTEYGHGKPLPAIALSERLKMFQMETLDLKTSETATSFDQGRGNGGWTTEPSFQGLVRRLLHAMHTNDSFTIVVVGSSRAAGQGNHFHQSYAMQLHKVLAPVLARLGVKLITRNLAQANMGTTAGALGFQNLYGDEIDLLLWDGGNGRGGGGSGSSGSSSDSPMALDLLYRQALLSGRKVPVLWGGDFAILKMLAEHVDAHVGDFGWGTDGILETQSETQVETLPRCVQYMKCNPERQDLCDNDERYYCASCWLDRVEDDGTISSNNDKELFTSLGEYPEVGQVDGMPGWKQHQLVGRVLTFSILDALQEAVQIWSDGTMGGPPLNEEDWHVTEMYNTIREKVKNLDPSIGDCYKLQDVGIPARVCKTPMKGRGLYTPRFQPNESSLLSIVRPDAHGKVPENQQTVTYEGPDGHNHCYDIPEGEIDVLAIVSNRRGRQLFEKDDASETILATSSITGESDHSSNKQNYQKQQQQPRRHRGLSDIVPGSGWELVGEKPGVCDGTYYSICGRALDDPCPALGQHDSRGMLIGGTDDANDNDDGWLVLDLPDVREGIILLRYELIIQELPDAFAFEFAINDGQVTSWNKEVFLQKTGKPAPQVDVLTLLDDSKFVNDGPAVAVEVSIRTQGCPPGSCAFGIPHVYWA